jgi:hypothetical protein
MSASALDSPSSLSMFLAMTNEKASDRSKSSKKEDKHRRLQKPSVQRRASQRAQ